MTRETAFLASAALLCSHGAVTHHHPARMLILQAGGAASQGITRPESCWGGEGLQAVNVAGAGNSLFPWGAAQLLGQALLNG